MTLAPSVMSRNFSKLPNLWLNYNKAVTILAVKAVGQSHDPYMHSRHYSLVKKFLAHEVRIF